MKINKYPDGSSYCELTNIDLKGHSTFRINTYEDLWHLNQFVDAYNYHYKAKPKVTIPWLIDGQADRRFDKVQSFGLKLVCKLLNNMNADFRIFHPHNESFVTALMDNIEIIDNSSFINKIINNVILKTKKSDYRSRTGQIILMSPDAGAFKPMMSLCNSINWQGETYSASKYRDSKTGKLTQVVDREDFEGKDILIVDDLLIYGGTAKGLAKMLRERNTGKLYLAVSHMTVNNLGKDPVTNYFDQVFTTNSKYEVYGVSNKDGQPDQPENLTVIKMFEDVQ